MKLLLILAMIATSTSSFARSITIVVEGEVFSCTSGGSGGTSTDCAAKAKRHQKRNEACVEARGISYRTECFNEAFKSIDKGCEEVSQACNTSCVEARGISYRTECYNYCY